MSHRGLTIFLTLILMDVHFKNIFGKITNQDRKILKNASLETTTNFY